LLISFVPLPSIRTQDVLLTFIEVLPADRRTVRYRHNEAVAVILQLFVAKVQNAMLPFHSGWNLRLTVLWRGKRVIGGVNNGDYKDWFENV